MGNRNVPVNTPLLGVKEKEYLQECIDTGWISSEGPFVGRFEQKMASYADRQFGIAVSSGSAALDVAVKALGIGQGDEVILPTFTIISPAQSVISAGAKPVLVDSDPLTWNMNVDQIVAKITKRTKAIIVVHIYGLPVNLNPVLEICKKYNLLLIEDAAEMHGQTYRGQKCGSFGDISTFSFYPNKHITTGEGGMIVTNSELYSEKCRQLRNLAFNPQKRRFVHDELGWNYRMTNLQAAVGLAQLENIDFHINKKREIGNRYLEAFLDIKELTLPVGKMEYAENIFWVFGAVSETEERANELQMKLRSVGIGTRPFFWCMHEQPVFQKMSLFQNESYEHAELIARNGFYLPSGLGLLKDDIDYVIQQVLNLTA